jgi:hypothetical protein
MRQFVAHWQFKFYSLNYTVGILHFKLYSGNFTLQIIQWKFYTSNYTVGILFIGNLSIGSSFFWKWLGCGEGRRISSASLRSTSCMRLGSSEL